MFHKALKPVKAITAEEFDARVRKHGYIEPVYGERIYDPDRLGVPDTPTKGTSMPNPTSRQFLGEVQAIDRVARWQCNRFAAKYGVLSPQQALNGALQAEGNGDMPKAEELAQYAALLEAGCVPEPAVKTLGDLL